MHFLLFYVLLTGTIAHECGISTPIEEQTTEGVAPLGKWPWQVYVKTPNKTCGGTIIAERWILTAGHCFAAQFKGITFHRKPSIRTGVVNINEAANDDDLYEVTAVNVHMEYIAATYENDIALLELDKPINYSSTVKPICLIHDKQRININQQAWLTGFGAYIDPETDQLVKNVSNVLREAPIPLARHSECKKVWEHGTMEKVICAGAYGLGAGKGDSGGPLMVQSVDSPWYQVGVVSFGTNDSIIATERMIGGYTSIRNYCEWIVETTRGEAKCAESEVEIMLVKEGEREEEDKAATADEAESAQFESPSLHFAHSLTGDAEVNVEGGDEINNEVQKESNTTLEEILRIGTLN